MATSIDFTMYSEDDPSAPLFQLAGGQTTAFSLRLSGARVHHLFKLGLSLGPDYGTGSGFESKCKSRLW